MRFLISAISIAVMVVACGGGGGSGGNKIGGGSDGSSGGSGGGTTTPVVGSMTLKLLVGPSNSSSDVTTIAASERTARVQIVLKDAAGSPQAGEIVSFTQDAGLLVFSPISATALTDANGVAEIEVAAATTTSLGATKIVATSGSVSASKNILITTAVASEIDPQQMVQSVNFLGANPSDSSIVIQGAGGSGRSEIATLQFRLNDKSGTPVKDAVVDFEVIPAGAVQLNIVSAKSNIDGVVVTSVSSKNQPTAVIVKATVRGTSFSTQSGNLMVTNGVSTQGGFDLSASKYNLDLDTSGDSSTIRVAIVDSSGNPVADGVPVVATTDFGRVGTSSIGGCTTANGICNVEYQVQNPRPEGGGPVHVTFATQTGAPTFISDTLTLWVTSVSDGDFYSAPTGGMAIGAIGLSGPDAKCNVSWDAFLGTATGYSLPAGTTVTLKSRGSVVAGSVDTVLDKIPARAPVTVNFKLTDAVQAGTEQVEFTLTKGTTVRKIMKTISYPSCISQ